MRKPNMFQAQTAQWNSFAEALRTRARKMQESVVGTMQQAGGPAPLPQRLEHREKMLSAMLDRLRTIRTALQRLCDSLSEEQRKTADSLVPGMTAGQMYLDA